MAALAPAVFNRKIRLMVAEDVITPDVGTMANALHRNVNADLDVIVHAARILVDKEILPHVVRTNYAIGGVTFDVVREALAQARAEIEAE